MERYGDFTITSDIRDAKVGQPGNRCIGQAEAQHPFNSIDLLEFNDIKSGDYRAIQMLGANIVPVWASGHQRRALSDQPNRENS